MSDQKSATGTFHKAGELSRDVWSRGGGWQLPDLLASALGTLLLLRGDGRPAYFSSPWMSDFPLFDDRSGGYRSLFPQLVGGNAIMFSDYLARLAMLGISVRIITTKTSTSERFLTTPSLREARSGAALQARYADSNYHEKGILAPSFYIEGSMNITWHGVQIRGEKVTYHTAGENGRHPKIAAAYLEFDRRWEHLK